MPEEKLIPSEEWVRLRDEDQRRRDPISYIRREHNEEIDRLKNELNNKIRLKNLEIDRLKKRLRELEHGLTLFMIRLGRRKKK